MEEEKQEEPLTREDVLRLIEEHGGPEGLDLSKRNLEGIDLSSKPDEPPLDLHGINLMDTNLQKARLWDAKLQGANLMVAELQEANLRSASLEEANLWGAKLQGADLTDAELQGAILSLAKLQEADLWGANLQGANLTGANLQGADLTHAELQEADLTHAELQEANLWGANLEGADLCYSKLSKAMLSRAEISQETRLEDVDWGDFVLGDEIEGDFVGAKDTYRRLKQWHTQTGMYDIAAKFYYREMEAKRKARRWKKEPHLKLWSWAMRLLCGYGENPERVLIAAAVVIFGLAGLYTAFGSFSSGSFLSCLYYSAVSFTALGYGSWAPQPEGWAKGVGAAEAAIGVFMIALFLITFTRKMVR